MMMIGSIVSLDRREYKLLQINLSALTQEFEAHEIAALRSDLDEDRMKLDKYCEEYDILRDAFISMHDLLSPQYAAFLFEACNSPLQAHASFDGGLHAAISERIASQGFISSCDATSLSDRLKILFDHFGAVLLNFERRESASKVRSFTLSDSCCIGLDMIYISFTTSVG